MLKQDRRCGGLERRRSETEKLLNPFPGATCHTAVAVDPGPYNIHSVEAYFVLKTVFKSQDVLETVDSMTKFMEMFSFH